MSLDNNSIIMILGFAVNLLAILNYSNRHERRLTRVETIIKILARGINTPHRSGDNNVLGEFDGD